MILESIVTTKSADGSINIAPMGPHVDQHSMNVNDTFELRPFTTSQTFGNLAKSGCGVLHITDDALMFAMAAVHRFEYQPITESAKQIEGAVLADCCRWYEFESRFVDSNPPRATIQCRIVSTGRKRDFFGFNRAKNAVIEGAILATRINFIPVKAIQSEMQPLKVIVDKTGGVEEQKAFRLLMNFVSDHEAGTKCNSN